MATNTYFIANTSTGDGRLTAGRAYPGRLVQVSRGLVSSPDCGRMRIEIIDNLGLKVTFNPNVFLHTLSDDWIATATIRANLQIARDVLLGKAAPYSDSKAIELIDQIIQRLPDGGL